MQNVKSKHKKRGKLYLTGIAGKLCLFVIMLWVTFFFSCNLGMETESKLNPTETLDTSGEHESASEGVALIFQNSSNARTSVGIVYHDSSLNDYIKLEEYPAGSDRYIAEINLRPYGKTPYRAVRFSIYNSGSTSGFAVNIGDSISNNGGSGDSGTQSNDAELDIYYNELRVLGKQGSNPVLIHSEKNVMPLTNTKNIRFVIKNEEVSYWKNFDLSTTKTIKSSNLFALNNQSDSEGSRNHTIYAAFNRVIQKYSSRSGTGITMVYIYLEEPVTVNPADVWAFMDETNNREVARKQAALLSNNPSPHDIEKILKKGRYYSTKSTSFRAETVEVRDCNYTTGYWFIGPNNYNRYKKYPLLLVFHGGGNSTYNNSNYCRSLANDYITPWKSYANSHDVFIAAPWCDKNWGIVGTNLAVSTIAKISKDYPIDPDQVYLWGQSMGGNMTWRSGFHFPTRWAGIASFCSGYPNYTNATFETMQNLPIYHVWGKLDWLAPSGIQADKVIKSLGLNAISKEKPGGHELYPDEFANVLDFFFNKNGNRNIYPQSVIASTIYGPGTHSPTPKCTLSISELSNNGDNVTFNKSTYLARNYWLKIHAQKNSGQPARATGSYSGNTITISTTNVFSISVYLHDAMVDMTKPVKIYINGKVLYNARVEPSSQDLLTEAYFYLDPGRIYIKRLFFSNL